MKTGFELQVCVGSVGAAVQDRCDLALKLSWWFLESSFFFFSPVLQVLMCFHDRAPGSHELENSVLLISICLPAFQLLLTPFGQ